MEGFIDYLEHREFGTWWARVTKSWNNPPLDEQVPHTGGDLWMFYEIDGKWKLMRMEVYNTGFGLEFNGSRMYVMSEKKE